MLLLVTCCCVVGLAVDKDKEVFFVCSGLYLLVDDRGGGLTPLVVKLTHRIPMNHAFALVILHRSTHAPFSCPCQSV